MPAFNYNRRALSSHLISNHGRSRSRSPIFRTNNARPNGSIRTIMRDLILSPAFENLLSLEIATILDSTPEGNLEDLRVDVDDLDLIDDENINSVISDFQNYETDSSVESAIFSDHDHEISTLTADSVLSNNRNYEPASTSDTAPGPAPQSDEDNLLDVVVDVDDLESISDEEYSQVVQIGTTLGNQDEGVGVFISGIYTAADTDEPLEALQEPLREWSRAEILTASRTNRGFINPQAGRNFLDVQIRRIREHQQERFRDDAAWSIQNKENIPPPSENDINHTNSTRPARTPVATRTETATRTQDEDDGIINEEGFAPATPEVRDIHYWRRQTRERSFRQQDQRNRIRNFR